MVIKFAYLKGLKDVDPFNICGVDGRQVYEQGKGRVDVTSVITYKYPLVLNRKPVTVYLALGESVARKTIFS